MKSLSFKTKLILLVGSAILGLLVFGVMSFMTLNKVRIGGPPANELRQNVELGSDLSPATLDISLGRLVVYRMLDETDHDKLLAMADEFKVFEQSYNAAHDRWTKELPDGALKDLIAGPVHKSAMKYLQAGEK